MIKNKKYIIFRADADSKIGIGHFMRCFAIAQAWRKNNGNVQFITNCKNDSLLQRLKNEDIEIFLLEHSYPNPKDWEYTNNILSVHKNSWFVLDGYHFDENYQILIKKSGNKLLMIDDVAKLNHYCADIILNQNLDANENLYVNREPHTKLLIGHQYVLLRNEFIKWSGWKRKIPKLAKNVLISLGGGDFNNITMKVVDSLKHINVPNLNVKIVLGSFNHNLKSLEKSIDSIPFEIDILQNVQNMPDLMAWADIAILASGTTSWEAAFMGLPSILLILSDNQFAIANKLESYGISKNLGWYNEVSFMKIQDKFEHLAKSNKARSEMSKRGSKLIDGNGFNRVISEFTFN